MTVGLENAIIILDGVHSLQEDLRDAASFTLDESELDAANDDVRTKSRISMMFFMLILIAYV